MKPIRQLLATSAPLLAVSLMSFSAHAADDDVPPVLAIGSPLPEFAVKGTDGRTYTQDFAADAKVFCVIFTSNHCPDAVAAAARMEEFQQEYKDKGVAILAVNANNPSSLREDELGYSPYNDSFDEMKLFAQDYGWTFPYAYDGETQAFAIACGAQSTPHVFVFDADRKLQYTGRMDDSGRSSGPVEKSYLRNAFDALLAEKPIADPVTRSFGCSTKWLFKADTVKGDNAAWENREVTLAKLDEELATKLAKNGGDRLRLINFWSTTCGPCVAEFPDLVITNRRFQARNFEMITISMDPLEDEAKVLKFLTSRHAANPDGPARSMKNDGRESNNYLWAGKNPDKVAEAIDPEWTGALPHTVLISPDGKLVFRHTGELDATELRREILKHVD